METEKVVFSRVNVREDPITKGELVALLESLNNIEDSTTIAITCNFAKGIIKLALNSFPEENIGYCMYGGD